MASAGLLLPLIHLILAISRLSYNCYRHIRSTINRFSCVVPSLTRQSYRDFESVYSISGIVLIYSIFSIVDLIVALTSKPCAILYSSNARTLYITLLHLIKD